METRVPRRSSTCRAGPEPATEGRTLKLLEVASDEEESSGPSILGPGLGLILGKMTAESQSDTESLTEKGVITVENRDLESWPGAGLGSTRALLFVCLF